MKFITDEIILKSTKIPLLNPKQIFTSTFEYVSNSYWKNTFIFNMYFKMCVLLLVILCVLL